MELKTKIAQQNFKNLLSQMGLVCLTGIAGFSGYVFNIVIAKFWDALILGQLLAAIGIFSFISLPASLLVLPISKWSIQTKNWANKYWYIMAGVLVICCIASSLSWITFEYWTSYIKNVHPSWYLPLTIWMIASYLHAVNVGVLMGRRHYWRMGITTAIPVIGKLLLLTLYMVFSQSTDYTMALWAIAASSAMAVLYGAICVKQVSCSTNYAELPNSLWASSWVTLSTNAWMTWDTALAGFILQPAELAIYAITSTVGKIPFQLSNVLANIGISEAGWGMSKKQKTGLLILGVGVISIVGSWAFGDTILRLFDLREGLSVLLVYMGASIMLSLAYFYTGADAQQGQHTWGPLGITLVGWTIWAFAYNPTVYSLVWGFGICLTVALAGISLLEMRIMRYDSESCSKS